MDVNETAYSALPKGVVLNDAYQIMNVLGAGGFGITYLAWDVIRERHVVIKECLPGNYVGRQEGSCQVVARDEKSAQQFDDCLVNARLEAEILARISDPGVVVLYDLFDLNGTFYYVMEYIQGQILHDVMLGLRNQGQLLPVRQAESLLIYILEILERLHLQKIYHCDIKPSNIFIMPNGKPKLIDFGAVRSNDLQHEGLVQITTGYTPPEFYPGNLRELGPWSDVYELGATFYELLTGTVPEPGDQRFKVDRMVKISSIENLRKHYPLILLSSIDKALAPDHKNRFASAMDWIDFLDSYGSGRQIRTMDPESLSGQRMKQAVMPVKYKKKKNHTPLVMFLVLLLLAGGFLYGVKEGKINIDAYPELDFIRKMLGMEVSKPEVQSEAAPSDTGRDKEGQSGEKQEKEEAPLSFDL